MSQSAKQRAFSIVMVTYLRRYRDYFQPAIRSVRTLFPDVNVRVLVNGHPAQVEQLQYLREITRFLTDLGIEYLTFLEHQPLARLWNLGIILAKEETVLVLNDDVEVRAAFVPAFERIAASRRFSRLNGSFSHFFLTKDVVRRVGFFDEGYAGMGNEDWDYLIRLALRGEDWLHDEYCPGLTNYVAPSVDPTWRDRSDVANGKYAAYNLDYFHRKWQTSDVLSSDCPDLRPYFPFHSARLSAGFELSTVYDPRVLDTDGQASRVGSPTRPVDLRLRESAKRLKSRFRDAVWRVAPRLSGRHSGQLEAAPSRPVEDTPGAGKV